MNLPHLKELEVSNYKKFEHIHVKDLGKINLITGDNNVGKTTLLECFTFNYDNSFELISQIHNFLDLRNTNYRGIFGKEIVQENNYFTEFVINDPKEALKFIYSYGEVGKNIKIEAIDTVELNDEEYNKLDIFNSNILNFYRYCLKVYRDKNLQIVYYLYHDDAVVFDSHKMHLQLPSVLYRINEKRYFYTLEELYNNIRPDQKSDLIDILNSIGLDVTSIEIRIFAKIEMLAVELHHSNKFQPITFLGNGYIRIIRVIFELFTHSLNRYCIDEIENGIHFTKMKIVWRAIFRMVKQMNVQLFITTHSQECLEMFAEVAQEAEFIDLRDEVRQIEVEELEDNGKMKHYASVYNLDMLISNFNSEVNVRGGSLWRN